MPLKLCVKLIYRDYSHFAAVSPFFTFGQFEKNYLSINGGDKNWVSFKRDGINFRLKHQKQRQKKGHSTFNSINNTLK